LLSTFFFSAFTSACFKAFARSAVFLGIYLSMFLSIPLLSSSFSAFSLACF
jgi:hypothetical protein